MKAKRYLKKKMTNLSNQIRFLSSHEWVREDEVGILTVGISDYAQDLLGDIVFIELPEVGKQLDAEQESAIVESVKAASDIYAPLSGEVIEINEKLIDEPEMVNASPFGEGWFYKIRVADMEGFDDLLTEDEYQTSYQE